MNHSINAKPFNLSLPIVLRSDVFSNFHSKKGANQSYFDFTSDLFFFFFHICTKLSYNSLDMRSLGNQNMICIFSTLIDFSHSKLVTGRVADMARIT